MAASSTPPATAKPPSSTVKQEKKEAEKAPEAKRLPSKPPAQWEQHKPGPNDETISPEHQLPPKPEWYKKDGIDELERTMLPEWFDSSSAHRTPEAYIESREKVVEMSEALSNRNVTNAMIRRSIPGDAGSLQRLRSFLVNWGIINRDAINDSAPTSASLRPNLKKRSPGRFNESMMGTLVLAVTEQAAKKRKLGSSSPSPDWEEVAARVGRGATAEECEETFMAAPLNEDSPMAPDGDATAEPPPDGLFVAGDTAPIESHGGFQKAFIHSIAGNADPEVLKKVFDAAVEATTTTGSESVEPRASGVLGVRLSRAVENARGHEIDLALRLSKLLDARMQKLENRMGMLDDVEGILEAEKVALEMERRDLYTARCRHWFGGV